MSHVNMKDNVLISVEEPFAHVAVDIMEVDVDKKVH